MKAGPTGPQSCFACAGWVTFTQLHELSVPQFPHVRWNEQWQHLPPGVGLRVWRVSTYATCYIMSTISII